MVSDSADFGTIVLEIIKCGTNLVSEFFMIFSKIFELDYLHKNSALYSAYSILLSHKCTPIVGAVSTGVCNYNPLLDYYPA